MLHLGLHIPLQGHGEGLDNLLDLSQLEGDINVEVWGYGVEGPNGEAVVLVLHDGPGVNVLWVDQHLDISVRKTWLQIVTRLVSIQKNMFCKQ